MCPEDKLVLRRIIRVKGRIRWLNPSIKGSKIDKPIGLPNGKRWETQLFNWV